jgi:transcription elongation factor Elf1
LLGAAEQRANKRRTGGSHGRFSALPDFPRSLIEFQRRFSDDAAGATDLIVARWPNGFVCPACGSVKVQALATKASTFECAACHRQTSVTAGAVELPLTVWFWAAYLMATHSNDISALQDRGECGRGELIGVEDLRRAEPGERLLQGPDAEVGIERVRQPPCQDRSAP